MATWKHLLTLPLAAPIPHKLRPLVCLGNCCDVAVQLAADLDLRRQTGRGKWWQYDATSTPTPTPSAHVPTMIPDLS